MCELCEAAKKVIKGNYGNGKDRKKKLEDEGFCYYCVQNLVNSYLNCKYINKHGGHCLEGVCDDACKRLENYKSD